MMHFTTSRSLRWTARCRAFASNGPSLWQDQKSNTVCLKVAKEQKEFTVLSVHLSMMAPCLERQALTSAAVPVLTASRRDSSSALNTLEDELIIATVSPYWSINYGT